MPILDGCSKLFILHLELSEFSHVPAEPIPAELAFIVGLIFDRADLILQRRPLILQRLELQYKFVNGYI